MAEQNCSLVGARKQKRAHFNNQVPFPRLNKQWIISEITHSWNQRPHALSRTPPLNTAAYGSNFQHLCFGWHRSYRLQNVGSRSFPVLVSDLGLLYPAPEPCYICMLSFQTGFLSHTCKSNSIKTYRHGLGYLTLSHLSCSVSRREIEVSSNTYWAQMFSFCPTAITC